MPVHEAVEAFPQAELPLLPVQFALTGAQSSQFHRGSGQQARNSHCMFGNFQLVV